MRRFDTVKMTVVPKPIYVFTVGPIKILVGLLEEINSMLLKFTRRSRHWVAIIILKIKSKVGGLTLSNFRTYYKAIIFELNGVGGTIRSMGQHPEIVQHI